MKWVALGCSLVVAFFSGRWTAPAATSLREELSAPTQPADSEERAPSPRPDPRPTGPRAEPGARGLVGPVQAGEAPVVVANAPSPAHATATVSECGGQLTELRRVRALEEEQRLLNEGKPLEPPHASVDPRFTETKLKSALEQAFVQSRVPGAVGGVDCSEYPCLLYGRIRGSEDFMEKLERTRAFSAYEEDIMVALLWTATDEAERPRLAQGLEPAERIEQSLFAITLYPRKDRATLGDALDRRMRVRTMALWNNQSPFDETGR